MRDVREPPHWLYHSYKSLLRFDEERYAMLETIREYAREQLEKSGEGADVQRRHAAFFLALAESASMSAESDYGRRYDVLPPEQDNLRAAIDAALSTGEIELGLRLAVALENFWVITDPLEGKRRFDALLSEANDVDPILRARALRCYSGSCHVSGNHELAGRLSRKARAVPAEDDWRASPSSCTGWDSTSATRHE